jgi:hypothetical protein
MMCSSSLLFNLHSYTVFFMKLGEWGLVTAVANSADHHDQSIAEGIAHSGTLSRADWNVRCPVTLKYTECWLLHYFGVGELWCSVAFLCIVVCPGSFTSCCTFNNVTSFLLISLQMCFSHNFLTFLLVHMKLFWHPFCRLVLNPRCS